MNWLYLVILSNFLFAIVFALDKVLVKKIFSPLKYALIVGGLEGLAVVLIPFVDFNLPDNLIIAAAFLSGTCFVFGIYFFFKILLKYEVSWVVPLLYGVFVPIITFIFSRIFLNEILTSFQLFAFMLLILGGLIISFSRQYKFSAIFYLIVAAIFISLDFVFLKIVFNHTNFFTGYILSRFGGFLAVLIILSIFYSIKRKSIFENPTSLLSGVGAILIFKQFLAFVANLLLIYAISLGALSLINGLGGIRYVFLLVFAVVFAKKWPQLMNEPVSFLPILRKSIAILLIVFSVLILLIQPAETPGTKIWGADFSDLYSKQLGLNSREVLISVINDLKVKDFRLDAHWSEIEKIRGNYNFFELDFQIKEIEKAGGKIILAIGKRLPRWPECHIPEWAREIKNDKIINESLLKYMETTVNRYKDHRAIWAWQIENEPFLRGFGECPRIDGEFLNKEIVLVKKLDSSRPIILTDSGEFGGWFGAYKRADIFGTTMYRVVQSRFLPIGNFKYPLEPDYFKIKAAIMENLFGKKRIINIELQAEPWLIKRPPDVSLEEQLKVFDINQFKENIEYAKSVGFEKNYLWGIEWIYWMKIKQNHPEFWEEAKKLYNQ